MQRMGGGARKNTRKNGGGNDPRCGCDMRVGWDTSFGDMKQLGGGGCSAAACAGPLVPGEVAQQYGTGCGCAGSSGYTSLVPGLVGGKKNRTRRGGGSCRNIPISNGSLDPHATPENIGRTLSATRAIYNPVPFSSGGGSCGNIHMSNGALDPHASPENIGRTLSSTRAIYNPAPVSRGGGCPVQDACPFAGTGYCSEFYAKGGGGANGCGCLSNPIFRTGFLQNGKGYKMTKKNRAALRKWRKGQPIGFTMTSSLKAKGLIPRTSRKYRGKKVVSAKYK